MRNRQFIEMYRQRVNMRFINFFSLEYTSASGDVINWHEL